MADDYLLKVPEILVSFIRNLHPVIKSDIRAALHFLVKNPNGGKVLKEELHGLRSYRVKRYRIIYRFVAPEKILGIIAIGPRKNIYEETFKIISREEKQAGGGGTSENQGDKAANHEIKQPCPNARLCKTMQTLAPWEKA